MKYSVVLERVADGVRKEIHQPFDWDEEATPFYWSEGNMACDCNRCTVFGDAQLPACSETLYRLIEFRLADGRVVLGGES